MSKHYKAKDIEREIERLLRFRSRNDFDCGVKHGVETVERVLKDLPTIDIVICEECRWQDDCSRFVKSMDGLVSTALAWCSDGVRMEE